MHPDMFNHKIGRRKTGIEFLLILLLILCHQLTVQNQEHIAVWKNNEASLCKFVQYVFEKIMNKQCPFVTSTIKEKINSIRKYAEQTYQRIENINAVIAKESVIIQNQQKQKHTYSLSETADDWLCPKCNGDQIIQCVGSLQWRKCFDCGCMIRVLP